MALFELTELASYLQQDLDTATATLAREMATGIVEEVTGPLESVESVVTLPVTIAGIVELPATVVTAVTSVTVDAVAVDFSWRQPFPLVRLDDWTPPNTLDDWPLAVVTYTHGFTTVPAVAKAVAIAVAARAYTVTPPAGVTVQIDDYRESSSGTSDSTGVLLTAYERRALASVGGTPAYVTGP